MATGVEELIDMLYTMIDEAKNAPFSSEKCTIDRDKALYLLDDIKAKFPIELSEAKKIVNNRNEYMASAKREADDIRRRAEMEARQMIDTEQVMNIAKQKAGEVIRQAEIKARELRRSANEYCEDLLRRAEDAMNEAYAEARRTRSAFRAASGSAAAASDPESSQKNSRMFDVENQG